MAENRQKEVRELEQKALRMLENPQLFSNDETTKNFTATLHLWIAPSFTPDKHWWFYEPQRQLNPQPTPFVRQMIWQKEIDFQRLYDPLIGLKKGFHTEPTFEIKKLEIEKEVLENLYKELLEISFPAFATFGKSYGIDGVRHGIETFDFIHKTGISWWSVYPKEWQNIVEWFEKTRNFLENQFSNV